LVSFTSVTLVLQVGLPSSGEQYIHRLGRTGRAGAAGRGILILAPEEKVFLGMKGARELPITEDAQYSYAASQSSSTNLTSTTRLSVEKEREEIFSILGTPSVSEETKSAAYRAWLGYYNTFAKILGWNKAWLVDEAGRYVREAMRWEGSELPEVERRTLGKMGLKGVPGLNVVGRRAGAGGGVTGMGDGARASSTPRGETAV
jgi:ATP-dependent RNA helicase MSS116, mitochondrial